MDTLITKLAEIEQNMNSNEKKRLDDEYVIQWVADKLKIFYSTPSLYIKDLHSSQISWPLKFGDFFPYASEINVYWTGYFTSKPTLKYFERLSNNFLQVLYNLFTSTIKLMIILIIIINNFF